MIDNPIGIDKPIQDMQQQFVANLWADKDDLDEYVFNRSFNTRVFKNYVDNKLKPEILIEGSNRYEEVLFDNRLDVLSWFDVSDTSDSINGTQVQWNVGIFFAVNLDKLYPSLQHRAVEEVHRDVIFQLQKKRTVFETINIDLDEKAFGDFDIDNLVNYNLQPWHTFRVNCRVKFSYNNC